MSDTPIFMIYLLGILFFARGAIQGVDELHAKYDRQNIGSDIVRLLGARLGSIWIDLMGTLSIILWPLTLAFGLALIIRKRM